MWKIITNKNIHIQIFFANIQY